jgi:FkbM family methyltransferase
VTFDPALEPMVAPGPADVQAWADRLAGCRDGADLPRHPAAGTITQRDGMDVQLLHNGVAFPAGTCLGPWMTPVIERTGGVADPQRDAAYAEVLRRLSGADRPSLVELGSQTGVLSAWFAEAFPAASVTCLEPDPRYAEVVRATWRLNGVVGRLLHGVLGPEEQPWHAGTPQTDAFVHPSRRMGQVLVHRYSFQELLQGSTLEAVDLLAVDVRGDEPAVMATLADPLAARRVRWVMVSTTHHTIAGRFGMTDDVAAALESAGATVVLHRTPEECLGPAGIVVATFEPSDAARAPIAVSRVRARDSFHGDPAVAAEALRRSLSEQEQAADALRADVAVLRRRVDELDAELARSHGERDLLVTQLAHARHQRDEAAKGISAVVSRRSAQALRTLRSRTTRQ